MISYYDLLQDYKIDSKSYYDLSLDKVIEYFKENEIKDLMEYGSDGDEGLYHLSSMYQEIMDQLGIKYSNVYTKDVSDGKYLTTIIFENDSSSNLSNSSKFVFSIVAVISYFPFLYLKFFLLLFLYTHFFQCKIDLFLF